MVIRMQRRAAANDTDNKIIVVKIFVWLNCKFSSNLLEARGKV